MIITLVVILTMVFAPRLTLWQLHNAADARGYQRLIAAKAAILAHAANPGADANPGRRLGQISFTPDLPAAAGATFSGLAGQTLLGKPGCATRTWTPGQPLIDPNGPVTKLDVRCFGRFPWLSYGLEGPSTDDDEGGTIPWMFLSANLVVGSGCVANLNPLLLSMPYTGACLTGLPFPWLKVVDDRGNLLSSEVAIVLILPGPPLNNAQQRMAPNDHSPAAYLEGLTVVAGCTAPCVPGTYNNAAYTVNGQAWTFIDAPPSTALGPQPAYYQQPFAFNDRLIYITVSEYFEAMETRARLAALSALSQFRKVNGYLPYSGDKTAPLSTACGAPHSRFGLLGATGNCGGTRPLTTPLINPAYPTWYSAAGWGSYFIYAVDAGCVQTATIPGCLTPSLQLGGVATRYNAVLLSPGRAIQNAPYAVTKVGAQMPVSPGRGLVDFLDSLKNITTGLVFDAAGTPPTANYNDRMYGIP